MVGKLMLVEVGGPEGGVVVGIDDGWWGGADELLVTVGDGKPMASEACEDSRGGGREEGIEKLGLSRTDAEGSHDAGIVEHRIASLGIELVGALGSQAETDAELAAFCQ